MTADSMTRITSAISTSARRNRGLVISFAAYELIVEILRYPFEYLFIPDRDIWIVQIGTWLGILSVAFILGLLSAVAADRLRELISSRLRRIPFESIGSQLTNFAESAFAPAVLAILSALVATFVWGFHPTPFVHDEAAYLLQAKLFSTFRWTAPAAPIPRFFEQMYVFVSPFTAAKYPPGFSLALVPGVWLNLPVLVPITLYGVSGGFLFCLARDIEGPCFALLPWLLWTTLPHSVWVMPPFLSEQLSCTLILGVWWLLLSWSRVPGQGKLVAISGFIAWGAITRPLTMLAAAIPAACVIIRILIRRHRWRPVILAASFGLAILLIVPIWSWKTTGNWKVTPLALHVRWYTPFDSLGFGWSAPPPERRLPDDLQNVLDVLSRERRRHSLARIPFLVRSRLTEILRDAFPGRRALLVPLLIFGTACATTPALVGLITSFLVFGSYLLLAHPIVLLVYYYEVLPVLAFLGALGVWRLVLGEHRGGRKLGETNRALHGVVALVLVMLMVGPALSAVRSYRIRYKSAVSPKRMFQNRLIGIVRPSVVFVHYPKFFPAFVTVIENGPDFSEDPVWVVHDLEEENSHLIRRFPSRTPYLYLTEYDRLIRLDRPFTPTDRRLIQASGETWCVQRK